jgi:hypothetical protein
MGNVFLIILSELVVQCVIDNVIYVVLGGNYKVAILLLAISKTEER